jgi:hypothetical protein
MKSTLQVDDEIEIPFVHAEFIPALVQDIKKVVDERPRSGESREEFERDRMGEGGARC